MNRCTVYSVLRFGCAVIGFYASVYLMKLVYLAMRYHVHVSTGGCLLLFLAGLVFSIKSLVLKKADAGQFLLTKIGFFFAVLTLIPLVLFVMSIVAVLALAPILIGLSPQLHQ